MKKLLIIAILVSSTYLILILFTSCEKDAQSTEKIHGFKIEFLFEKDNVKVYRFYDNGYSHYFTTNGETMTTQSNGKYSYHENIN